MNKLVAVIFLAGWAPITAWSQANYPKWPFSKSLDAAQAAAQTNKLLFEDSKLRLFEVTIRPGEQEKMNGHPYPSVIIRDAPAPDPSLVIDSRLDPKSPLNGQDARQGTAPQGMQFPTCEVMGPLAPHRVKNAGAFPIHFYRLEFKRLDGNDLPKHWREWYPWMLGPIPVVSNLDPRTLGPPYSKEWPYPIELDSVKAAPNNHKALYADAHVRLVEVTERPESQENLHGHPYYSVFINDSLGGPRPRSGGSGPPPMNSPLGIPGPYHKGENGDYALDPTGPQMRVGVPSGPPEGMLVPSCMAASPQPPHAHINGGETPGHFYRFEFVRLDGDAFKTQWRAWYPRETAASLDH
jgi:hypothetical protein